jgi:OHCU decarboxylase
MIAERPFGSPGMLFAAAERVWGELKPDDWLEAFSKHPRIGETKPVSAWSADEQKGMNGASAATAESIAEMNRLYYQKFGWIFLICATGKTAEEMLDQLAARLRNEPNQELHIAMGEQAKITRIRLGKLLGL